MNRIVDASDNEEEHTRVGSEKLCHRDYEDANRVQSASREAWSE